MTTAIYLNGVFVEVLNEILNSQTEEPGLICYLQPQKNKKIRYLNEAAPTLNTPVTLSICQ